MSWIAVAGVAVAAGGTMYAANQQKKAGEKQAEAIQGLNTEPVLLGDPAQVNPIEVLQQLYSANTQNFGNARDQARMVNKFNKKQAFKSYEELLPGFGQYQATLGNNINAWSRGELSGDEQSAITRAAAQQGIQGGFGFGSQGASGGALGNLNLRNLGLKTHELARYGTSLGMQAGQYTKAMLPNLMGLQDFMLNPQQALGINQYNVGNQNQFALQNNQLLNQQIADQNALQYQGAQTDYMNQMAQAQMIGSASQSAGGLISGLGAGQGTGVGTAGWGGDYHFAGNPGKATFNGRSIPRATLA